MSVRRLGEGARCCFSAAAERLWHTSKTTTDLIAEAISVSAGRFSPGRSVSAVLDLAVAVGLADVERTGVAIGLAVAGHRTSCGSWTC
jgi:hypothetical protein